MAAQAYRVKNGNWPADIAAITGAGDLEQTPSGPRAVTYSFAAGVVTATENGQDAFGATTTVDTATYTITTGAYAGF